MAKRRKLETPSTADLDRIEEEFRRETSLRPAHAVAPIAQVAAETAEALEMRSPEERAASETLRSATEEGRMIVEIPLSEIAADSMIRDRTILVEEELVELQNSIASHGMRLPVELYELPESDGQGARYGLLSGYRRVLATLRLRDLMGGEKFTTIKALIRDPETMGGSVVAMVEENEIRSTLSPFERGRIAVIAAQNGAFVNVEAAVDTLFAAASKAKRSKIRSFALVFEELGDLLEFPESLSEKQGLSLATALRAGAEPVLRSALESARPETSDEEWNQLEASLSTLDSATSDPRKGGRPTKRKATKTPPDWAAGQPLKLSTGWTLVREIDRRGPLVRIEGREISADVMDDVMDSIRRCLETK